MSSLVATSSTSNTKDKVDNDSSQKSNSQHRRTKAIIETTLTPHTNALCSPVIGDKCVDHCSHGDQSEKARRDLTNLVAEVEETDGETAEDDGEVQPAEKGALVGEEDFGLDAGGEGNALACGKELRVSGVLRDLEVLLSLDGR